MKNFKVKCISKNEADQSGYFTLGKVYKIINEEMTVDSGEVICLSSFQDLDILFYSKFELYEDEIIEPKDILQVGMIAVFGDGSTNMVVNYLNGMTFVDRAGGIMYFEDYDSDLAIDEPHYEYSVDKIFGLATVPQNATSYTTIGRELLWERDCITMELSKVLEIAEEQVGKKIKIIER